MFALPAVISWRTVVLGIAAGAFLGWPIDEAVAQKSLLRETYDTEGTLRIEVESVFSAAPSRGFMPVKVTLRNMRKSDRTWTLRFNFGGSWNEMSFESTFRLSAEAGTEPVHTIMVPVPTAVHTGSMYRNTGVEVNSPGLPSRNNNDSSYYSTGWPAIGLSKKLGERNTNRLDSAVQSRSGSSHSEVFGGRFDPKSLPADWRGYTSLDVLMMTDEEWRTVSPGAQLAIREWIRLGGRLDLYGRSEPGAIIGDLDLPGAGPTASSHALSLGSIHAWKWNGQDLEPNTMVSRYRKIPNRGAHLADDYTNSSSWGLYQQFGEKSFNPWLVILLLIAFGIIVGPINLFVWAKPGKRHRLFVTTPIISVAASGMIMLLILFNDGIGGSGGRIILANLQSEADEKRLYVTQEQISRTGVLLGTGFRVDDPVFLSPVMIPQSEWNRINLAGNVVARFSLNGRTYRGDWFQSRSEQGQYVQSVRPTRSRIELTESASGDSPPKLFSSLEFTVDRVFYRDDQGRVWKSKEGKIAGGQEIVLAPAEAKELTDWWAEEMAGLSSEMREQARLVRGRNGQFFAVSSDRKSGFVDTLRSINWKREKALVFGSVLKAGGGGQPVGSGDAPERDGDE